MQIDLYMRDAAAEVVASWQAQLQPNSRFAYVQKKYMAQLSSPFAHVLLSLYDRADEKSKTNNKIVQLILRSIEIAYSIDFSL